MDQPPQVVIEFPEDVDPQRVKDIADSVWMVLKGETTVVRVYGFTSDVYARLFPESEGWLDE